MSFLDDLLAGYKVIAIAGSKLVARPVMNFVAGATAVDNPVTGATDVTVTGAGPGGPRTVLTVTHSNAGVVTGPTDDVYIDATGGGATVKLTASPTLGEWHRITCTNGVPVVDANGNSVGSWAPSNQAFASTATITQVGQGGTVQWNGSAWWWV